MSWWKSFRRSPEPVRTPSWWSMMAAVPNTGGSSTNCSICPASGYEFELEMLIAAKHLGLTVLEEPIRTIYEPGNPTSHFQPLRDSMRIYFVLLRFGFISMMTAGLDNLAFYLFFHASGTVVA